MKPNACVGCVSADRRTKHMKENEKIDIQIKAVPTAQHSAVVLEEKDTISLWFNNKKLSLNYFFFPLSEQLSEIL